MKKFRFLVVIALLLSLLMSGCVTDLFAKETVPPTETPTEAPTEVPTEAPTEAPTEPPLEKGEYRLAETVFPETDKATGTLKFYINDAVIYAGGPVADLLSAGVTTMEDFTKVLQPWHMSSVQRVRVEMEGVEEADLPFVFFIAVNASDEPRMISECLFYSITINTDDDVKFGSGNEAAPFVTGVTTKDEMVAAYGEPDYTMSRKDEYVEIAYYEPFSCAYFSFKNDVVRQVTSYYSANFLGRFTEEFTYDFGNSYFGNDAYILMSQYMDVMPYLKDEEVTSGVMEALTEEITMGGATMKMDTRVMDMPSPFVEQFKGQLVYLNKNYYVRVGRNVGEEFFFININGQKDQKADLLLVKGVMTRNKNHGNWGKDKSNFYEFQYENLTNDSTIEDILEQYGMPYDIHCTSYARGCFVWLFYKDQAGNTLEISVDPILNQIVELQFNKFYKGEKFYT